MVNNLAWTVLVLLVAMLILTAGSYLECAYGNIHIARSGALLVMVALIVAVYRERQARRIDARYMQETIDYIKWRFTFLELRSRGQFVTLMVEASIKDFLKGKSNLEQALARRPALSEEQKRSVDEMQEKVRKHEAEIQPLQSEKEEYDKLLPLHEDKLEREFKEQGERDEKMGKQGRLAHYGELVVACMGTIVWAYGDILFAQIKPSVCQLFRGI